MAVTHAKVCLEMDKTIQQAKAKANRLTVTWTMYTHFEMSNLNEQHSLVLPFLPFILPCHISECSQHLHVKYLLTIQGSTYLRHIYCSITYM